MQQEKRYSLGRNRLIDQLAARISRHFDPKTRNMDRSLVIGIFGEWGSGKSWVLEQLGRHFAPDDQRGKKGNDEAPFIIPILFNPWRFEAEEHLIIPLLMTVHDRLAGLESRSGRLKEASEHFWQSALAFAAAWKFKVGICTFDPSKALDAQEKLRKREKEAADKDTPDFNSYYYNFESKLKEFSDKGLNFLFLIDDIDRCLPERAVQMLEAIKLFLDVPGCVFVLGVDDEVVDRGIRYRYRDYNTDDKQAVDDDAALPPITGMEYLEKIIHLPIRLPLMQESQVRQFLQERYADFFSPARHEDAKGSRAVQDLTRGNQQAEELLELFVRAVPRIPRKLIRAAELLGFLHDLPHHFQPDRLLLARLVLLQLFAPEVYRHLRRVNPELVRDIIDWHNAGHLHLNRLHKITARKHDDTWQSEQKPLIDKLRAAARNRNNFDPCAVFEGMDSLPSDLSVTDHIHLIGERTILPDSLSSDLAIAELADPEDFLNNLFNQRAATWRKACDDDQVRGKVLDNTVFELILVRLNQQPKWLQNLEWLETIARRLAPEQLDHLDTTFSLRDRVIKEMQNTTTSRELAERALAGRTLGLIGDPRRGVAVQQKKPNLPDIDWVRIPAGTFAMGSEDEEAYDDEQPVHQVSVPGFAISRYPVTNRQYRCFIEAGGYEEQRYWTAAGAREWLQGELVGEKLLETISDKEFLKRYRRWLQQDTDHTLPRFWHDRKWNNPNHPVVGISWYEALAYCAWLSEQTGQPVRLPGEEEWEYAARGQDSLRYAWGNEFAKDKGNTEETGLQRTTSVGLFPKGRAFALYDMTGNVWEWTASRWGKNVGKPDFGYADWDKSEAGKARREDKNVLEYRIIRGGSWDSSPRNVRCAVRYRLHPNNRDFYIGFRLVFSLASDF